MVVQIEEASTPNRANEDEKSPDIDVSNLGELLKNIEVRAGFSALDSNFKGKIKVNKFCGEFLGPGANRRSYTILCSDPISADFITVQTLENKTQLQINEIELITTAEGKLCYIYVTY